MYTRDVRFRPNLDQIGPNWDKYRTFPDQISVGLHLGSTSHHVQKFDLEKFLICLILGQSNPHCAKIWHPICTQPNEDLPTLSKLSTVFLVKEEASLVTVTVGVSTVSSVLRSMYVVVPSLLCTTTFTTFMGTICIYI